MATKIQNTPTTNIFSVLADENPHQAQPKKQSDSSTPASTSATEKIQSTPAARAASKALQEKRKEEVEKAKKPTASDADVKPEDLEGFSKQRGQRQKDKRQTPQEPPKETNKNFNKDKKFNNKNKNTKNNGEDSNIGNNNNSNNTNTSNNNNNISSNNTNKPYNNKVKGPGGPGYKSDKPYNHASRDRDANAPRQEVIAARPKRDHDKQSQGQYPRKPIAKKQGHGTGNWGEDNAAEAVDDTLQTHEPTPSVVTDDDPWAIPPATSEAPLTDSADTNAAPDATTDANQDDAASAKNEDLGLEDFVRQRAEKAQELASKYGPKASRDYTEEEKKNLEKFQMIVKDKTPEFPLPGPKSFKDKDTTTPASTATRKGEKSVAVEDYFRIPPPVRNDRGPGRGRGGGRGRGEGRGGDRSGEGNKDSAAAAGQAQASNEGQQNQNQAPNSSDNKPPRGGKGPGGRGGKPQGQSQRKFDVKNNHQFPSLG